MDKRDKTHSCPSFLAVPVIKISLYIFPYRMGCVVSHAASWNKVLTFGIWSLLVSNLFNSAVKIAFIAIKMASSVHLLFPLCSTKQLAVHQQS